MTSGKDALTFFGTDRNEFEKKLRGMGLNPTEEEIDYMIRELIEDKTNQLGSDKSQDDEMTHYLTDAFKVFHNGDSPKMTKGELETILRYGDEKILSDEDIADILKDIKDNEFDYEKKIISQKFSKSDYIHSTRV